MGFLLLHKSKFFYLKRLFLLPVFFQIKYFRWIVNVIKTLYKLFDLFLKQKYDSDTTLIVLVGIQIITMTVLAIEREK